MFNIFRFIFHRIVFFVVFLAFQLVTMFWVYLFFKEYFYWFNAACSIFAILLVLYILNGSSNPGYKIAWIFPILLAPMFGSLFYLMYGGNRLTARERKKMARVSTVFSSAVTADPAVPEALARENTVAAAQSSYIAGFAFCPPYRSGGTEYFPWGEDKFISLLRELQKAERYIFLEYFTIKKGRMWDSVLAILKEKAVQGVDVRVIYDDMGCFFTLPRNYPETLRSMGIRCAVFNPVIPLFSSRFNNRSHRKICVIDGKTGYTGGINLTDESINEDRRLGTWKDAAILLRGAPVWSFTMMFLSMWEYLRNCGENYEAFRPEEMFQTLEEGYVQPFSDNPLDEEPVGETVYFNLINKAQKYVYINTPYLILGNEILTALCAAAKTGVDVRIVTPFIPDKWYVHTVTQSYYDTLISAGVKIYEYTPGFMHAKTFVCDDQYGVVGSINLDYRSLYLHFECAVWMYHTPSIETLKQDYLRTLSDCRQITAEDCCKITWTRRITRSVLRAFAPLM